MMCVQDQVKEVIFSGASLTSPPTCRSWSPIGRSQLCYLCQRKICHYATSHFPLGVTNEEVLPTPIKLNFWRRCRGRKHESFLVNLRAIK